MQRKRSALRYHTCISCDACFDAEGLPLRKNIALKAASSQSTTTSAGVADHAVDDDSTHTRWMGGRRMINACAYTDSSDHMSVWWRVDLQSPSKSTSCVSI